VRFFLDHDVPKEIARVLRQAGHEVIELRQVLATYSNDGIIILIRRRSRLVECAHLLALLSRAGEYSLQSNINFA
jgi:predicted nuclease of predicted toxin-antitoxin system